jgi:Stage II sporulation protein E (SpoIIE)/GAF domain
MPLMPYLERGDVDAGDQSMHLSGWRERRRASEARDVLAAAGAVFDSSLDPRETMKTIARTAVPGLADMCAIYLLREDGEIGETVAVAVREEVADRLERVRREHPTDLTGSHPLARALRSGEPVVIRDLTDPHIVKQIAQGSTEYAEFLAWAGYRSSVVMPLIARERILGAMSFLYARDNRRYDPDHLSLIRDLCARAAMAIDNARLYEESAHAAHTLQLSLLPEALPAVEGVKLASAYHPSGEGGEVGGDFYDAFVTPSGCWLVVGDACGKGPDAAALTALVRHSVRALAFVWSSPARVLEAVNEVMLGHDLACRFATVVLARLDLSSAPAKAVIAGAGHPAPLVLGADGSARDLPLRGMLLGVRSDPNLADVELELEQDASLLLYTDGLLDAGAPTRAITSVDLRERLSGHARAQPRALVEELERLARSAAAGRLRDDIAIVVAQIA